MTEEPLTADPIRVIADAIDSLPSGIQVTKVRARDRSYGPEDIVTAQIEYEAENVGFIMSLIEADGEPWGGCPGNVLYVTPGIRLPHDGPPCGELELLIDGSEAEP